MPPTHQHTNNPTTNKAEELKKPILRVPCELVKPGYVLQGVLSIGSDPPILRFHGEHFKDPVCPPSRPLPFAFVFNIVLLL